MSETTQIEVIKKDVVKALNPFIAQRDRLLADSQNMQIIDSSTYQGVRSARTNIQKSITSTKEVTKDIKRPFLTLLDDAEFIKNSIVDPLETRKAELIKKIKAWDDKKAEEKRKEEEAEKQRITALKDEIQAWFDEINNIIIKAESNDDIAKATALFTKPMEGTWVEFESEYLAKRETLSEALKNKRENLAELIELRRKEKEQEGKRQQEQFVTDKYKKLSEQLSQLDTEKAVKDFCSKVDRSVGKDWLDTTIALDTELWANLDKQVESKLIQISHENELKELRLEKEKRDREDQARKAKEEADRIQKEKDAAAKLEAENKAKEEAEYRKQLEVEYLNVVGKKATAKQSNDELSKAILAIMDERDAKDLEEMRKVITDLTDFVSTQTDEFYEYHCHAIVPESYSDVHKRLMEDYRQMMVDYVFKLEDVLPKTEK